MLESLPLHGSEAARVCPAALAGRAGAGRNAAASWRRSASGSFWLRGSDWKAGLHRAADLLPFPPVFPSSPLPKSSLASSPGPEVVWQPMAAAAS